MLDRSVEWFLGLIYDVGRSLIFGNFMSVDSGSAWEGVLVSYTVERTGQRNTDI